MYYLKSVFATICFIFGLSILFPEIWNAVEVDPFFPLGTFLFYSILFGLVLKGLLCKREAISYSNFLQNKNTISNGITLFGLLYTITLVFQIFEGSYNETLILGLAISGFTLLAPLLFPFYSIFLANKAKKQDSKFSLFLYRNLRIILYIDIVFFILVLSILKESLLRA